MNFEHQFDHFDQILDNACLADLSDSEGNHNRESHFSNFNNGTSSTNSNSNMNNKKEMRNGSGSMRSNGNNSHISTTSNSSNNKKKSKVAGGAGGWIARQIAAAYDEHASLIKKLESDLQSSKSREQALMSEFEAKFRMQQQQISQQQQHLQQSQQKNQQLQQAQQKNAIIKIQQQQQRGGVPSLTFEDEGIEDMPMDEMAATTKLELNSRTMQLLEQKREIEVFQKQSQSQLVKIQKQNHSQLNKFKDTLKEKMKEIETLKKQALEASNEANFYKTQAQQLQQYGQPNTMQKTASTIAATGAPAPTAIAEQEGGELAPIPFQPSASFKPTDTGNNGILSLVSVFEDEDDEDEYNNVIHARDGGEEKIMEFHEADLIHPIPLSPKSQRSNITPINRLRSKNNQLKLPQQKQHIITPDTANTTPTSSGSKTRSNIMTASDLPTPRKLPLDDDTVTLTSSSRNDLYHDPASQSNNTTTSQHIQMQWIQKLSHVIFHSHNNQDTTKTTKQQPLNNLNELELEFVQSIQHLLSQPQTHSSPQSKQQQKDDQKMIKTLTNQLQQANQEIKMSASQLSSMNKVIEEQTTKIQLLKNQQQLNKTNKESHDSDKQKTHQDDNARVASLLKENEQLKEEIETSVSAMKRVMVDVSNDKDLQIESLNLKIQRLNNENKSLQQRQRRQNENSDGKEKDEFESPLDEYDYDNHDMTVSASIDLIETKERNIDLTKSLVKANETMESLKKKYAQQMNEIQKRLDAINHEKTEMENEIKTLQQVKEEQADQYQKMEENLVSVKEQSTKDIVEREKTIDSLLKSKSKLQSEFDTMQKQMESYKDQLSNVEEVINAAKDAHAREQNLENELNELTILLDNAMKSKDALRDDFHTQKEKLNNKNNDFDHRISQLQTEILSTKEERLTLKTKLRESQDALEHNKRLLSLLQETNEMEDSAPLIVLDMKEQLRAQKSLANEIRHRCDEDGNIMIDQLNDRINNTLCLLHTAIFGNMNSISNSGGEAQGPNNHDRSHLSISMRERMSILKAENEKMRKDIEEEVRGDLEGEVTKLHSDLKDSREKIVLFSQMLCKKEEELNVLRSSLNDASVGYISGDESDTEDEKSSNGMLLHLMKDIGKTDTAKPIENVEEIIKAKEKAEMEAKENADRLENAKLIISSLEQSNKTMTEDLRSRLSESNAAIVSLLDQSGKQEKMSSMVKSELEELKAQKVSIESELSDLKKKQFQGAAHQQSMITMLNVTTLEADDNDESDGSI